MGNSVKKFSPEVRARAVRLVLEHEDCAFPGFLIPPRACHKALAEDIYKADFYAGHTALTSPTDQDWTTIALSISNNFSELAKHGR
ncbi:hypothetical protein ANI02nite_26350 [Acetobacter nitrogenifigens DSM 23921 = NBRC 105050]|uniref:Uncharacterized protein n=1 Tax=Acetobacter nitrogenifigens DSM 23921 = NBRC 105050 TaxID=1120919 RepID=A0A511XCZ8_9PROT|nr:hypothetical protein ANI02nite_26350 [Acetobacter nitrogenifigens DSM 23921 = NBRC 105050]